MDWQNLYGRSDGTDLHRRRRTGRTASLELAAAAALRLEALTFWQAVGILALCRILFGNFGGRPMWRSDYRRRMAQRLENMTPEEREKFKRGFGSRCGAGMPPTGDAKGSA